MTTLFKRAVTVCISTALVFGMLAGCGGNNAQNNPTASTGGSAPNGTKIVKEAKLVIHVAGSIKEGKDDKLVKAEIEKNFAEDTGIKLDLDLRLHTNEDFNTKVNLAIAAAEQFDGLENFVGEDGVNQYITRPGFAMELNDLINNYGNNLKKQIPQLAFDSVSLDSKIVAIPGVHYESEFGILIRKDWVEEAGLQMPKTLEEFENVLKAFKERGNNTIPLIGAPWDMDRVLLPGSYGAVPYFWSTVDENGILIPGYVDPKYKSVLIKQYQWAKTGLWDRDNTTRPASSMDNQFISGKAGVYIAWPEIIHLIDISRKCKAANPNAKFEILGPMTGPDGKSGFAKQPLAFTGVVVPKMSQNADVLVKYFNWLYSSKENYELAAYGLKDIDWVDAGENLRGFPAGKEEAYVKEPPYSGAYKILTNINMADRILTSYTEEERGWINNVRQFKTIVNPTESIMFPATEDKLKIILDEQKKQFFAEVVQKAWAGIGDPETTFEKYAKIYTAGNKDYLTAINDYYNKYKK